MNIADRIQTLRKSKGISQEELADKIGVSRQAVSKWESEQSTPDIEKIILLSEYFGVTTDYLLKGIEPVSEGQEMVDARIFTIISTVLNFIGLVTAIIIWIEEQRPISVGVGLIVMAIGCMIFAIGQIIGNNKQKAAIIFGMVNVWILSLIPISCAFNFLQGTMGGHWWTFSPIPQLGNSVGVYGACWIGWFIICVIVDVVIQKCARAMQKRNGNL